MKKKLENYLSVNEFHKQTKVSRSNIYEAIKDGRLKHVLVGREGHVFIPYTPGMELPFNKSIKRTQNEPK